jgi:hypothetical protein
MKNQKQNKKYSEKITAEELFTKLSNGDKSLLNYTDEHEIECQNKCRKLDIDKKRKMVGLDFEYIYNKCDKLNEYISTNNGSCRISEYKVIVGGLNEDELKYKQLYVEENIRLILEDVKLKPIEYFESYVNGVKHLKQEYKIHKNSQILMHDDDDEIAIQASYNL